MKLAIHTEDFCSRGVQKKVGYSVATTPQMMDLLSNKLYKYKVKAVIRELSTNAWDAMVMAGTTHLVPLITLPTTDNPTFRLRDYGTGLSQQELETMYNTYGASNKDHSNEYNGCMGIGSKSPFCYTDAFTTVSYYNGMKYVYVNTKSAKDIMLMHSEPTEEPNGLEISMAVDVGDIQEFYTEAKTLLKWFPKMFDVLPKGIDMEANRRYRSEGDNWKISEYHVDPVAVMGNVAYPIDPDSFIETVETWELQDNYGHNEKWYDKYNRVKPKNMTKAKRVRENTKYADLIVDGLELYFDIGEIEMDSAREGLQYNSVTMTAIKNRIDKMLKEVRKDIKAEVDASDCLWDAKVKYQTFGSKYTAWIRDQLFDSGDITWGGQEIDGGHNVKIPEKRDYDVVAFDNKYNLGRKSHARSEFPQIISTSDSTVIFMNDMRRGNYAATSRFLDANPKIHRLYLIKYHNHDVNSAMTKVIQTYGCQPRHIKLCSNVPKDTTPKDPNSSTKKKKRVERGTVFTLADRINWRSDNTWEDVTDIDFNAGGVYVDINAWRVRNKSQKAYRPRDMVEALRTMVTLGICKDFPTMYGVKTRVLKRYQDSKKWTEAHDWMEDKLKGFIKKAQLDQHEAKVRSYKSFEDRHKSFHDDLVTSKKQVADPQSELLKVIEVVEDHRKVANKVEGVRTNIQIVCKVLPLNSSQYLSKSKSASSVDLNKLHKSLKEHYPFFRTLGRWACSNSGDRKAIIETVNIIDSHKKGN